MSADEAEQNFHQQTSQNEGQEENFYPSSSWMRINVKLLIQIT